MGLMMATAVNAQEEPKLSVKPSGRILFDAAYINPQNQKDELKSGVAIPDMRVGVGFSYGKWKAKLDIGYTDGKVGLKDVFVQYDFDKLNSIRGGYFIHQYGFQSSTSSSFKETMEEPQSNAVFNNDRTLGVMYEYNGKKFLGTASIIVLWPSVSFKNDGHLHICLFLTSLVTSLFKTIVSSPWKFASS